MQIFYLDKDPEICAKYHMDKHVVKMIVESAQILSTTRRYLDKEFLSEEENEKLLKITHLKHPSVLWTMNSVENYNWLYKLFLSLLEEYTYRYEKLHAYESLKDILSIWTNWANKDLETLSLKKTKLPLRSFEPPFLAMPDEYKKEDHLEAYRLFYMEKKSHIAKWKKREIPPFYIFKKEGEN